MLTQLLGNACATVGMFGKYLNNVPNFRPVGFDQWMANGGGDYIAPSFQMYDIPSVPESAGKLYAWHGTDDAANYSTAVIGNMSMAFIRKAVSEQKPFMAYIAPKAAHEPFNPAPWYVGHWDDSWPAQEPRPPNWNASFESRKDHHGNIATEPLITDAEAAVITGVFKDRWRTLMSVDDVIGDVIDLCESLNVADNTYFLYSSDHGFQLGEFNIAMDKRNVYDWNTRIHLLARGPGIPHGVEWKEPATQVDIAPTFLGFAGVAKPEQMDGKSLVPLLTHPSLRHELNPTTVQHLERHLDALSTEGDLAYKAAWRDCVFIEYYYNDYNAKCMGDCTPPAVGFPERDSGCVDLESEPNSVCWQGCKSNCYQTETPANNYIAIRNMPGSAMGDTLYAEYQSGASNQSWTNMINIDFDKVDFVEYYDSSTDPWQMKNLHKTAAKDTLSALHEKVQSWYRCKGDACP